MSSEETPLIHICDEDSSSASPDERMPPYLPEDNPCSPELRTRQNSSVELDEGPISSRALGQPTSHYHHSCNDNTLNDFPASSSSNSNYPGSNFATPLPADRTGWGNRAAPSPFSPSRSPFSAIPTAHPFPQNGGIETPPMNANGIVPRQCTNGVYQPLLPNIDLLRVSRLKFPCKFKGDAKELEMYLTNCRTWFSDPNQYIVALVFGLRSISNLEWWTTHHSNYFGETGANGLADALRNAFRCPNLLC